MGNETSQSSKAPHPRQTAKFENLDKVRRNEYYCQLNSEVGKAHFQQTPPLPPDDVEVVEEPVTGNYGNRNTGASGATGGNTPGTDVSSTSQLACDASQEEIEESTSVVAATATASKNAKKREKRREKKSSKGEEEGQMTKSAAELASDINLEGDLNISADEALSQSFMQLKCGNEKRGGQRQGGIPSPTVVPSGDGGEIPLSANYIDPKRVQIGQIIGEGGFGRVFNATLNGVTKVVSKLILVPFVVSEEELHQLLALKHRNFVTVIGVVRQTDEMDPPQLILCYYPEGNLLQFLKNNENPNDNGTLGKLAFDISEGCQFLHSSNVVHGNLAARNILIQKIPKDNKVYYNAKISDFGIIRYAEPSGGNYVKVPGSENRVVPLRWVPKEIIDGSVDDFTFSSDVWSFGVVLWEMWTKGEIPYGATYSNPKIIQLINDGESPLKLHPPPACPKNIVAVMQSTFQVDPMQRPTFTELLVKLQHFKGHGKVTPGIFSGAGVGGSGTTQSQHGIQPLFAAAGNVKVDNNDLAQNLKEGTKPQKKKKDKTKNADIPKSNSETSTHPKVATTETTGGKFKEAGGSTKTPKPQKAREDRVDSQTVEELIELRKKVAQLESERRGGGRGHTGRGAQQGQDKRGGTKPKSGRGVGGGRGSDNYRGGGGERGNSGVGRGGAASSPAPPPPYMPAPPPPYTEAPLPYHTSPHSSAPPPPYGYVQAGAKKEDETFAKMKRLEAEMALLKAEERMKEVAELMKVAAGSEDGGAPQFGVNPGIDQYYTDGQGSYGAATHAGPGGHRGNRQGGGQPHQFRPYHKPRGGGRARGRAGHHNEAH